jgi:hypothetical protein
MTIIMINELIAFISDNKQTSKHLSIQVIPKFVTVKSSHVLKEND